MIKLFGRGKKAEAGRSDNLPRHVAVIMDGNGRWAKKRGLPRQAGHAGGAETFRKIAAHCRDIGIAYLTVYAFSTENWARPQTEISAIMSLLEQYLREALDVMARDNIRMRVLGDISALSPELRGLIEKTDEISRQYKGFQANICINYGARAEIVRAAVLTAQAGDISERGIAQNLWSADIPDPDLIIRTGGEYRLSNFLLWQAAYSELYFTPTLWPDFTPDEIDRAIADYQRRNRRFGGIGEVDGT